MRLTQKRVSSIRWSAARLKLCEPGIEFSPSDFCFMSSLSTFRFLVSRLQSCLSHCPLGAGGLRGAKPNASTRGRDAQCFGSSTRVSHYFISCPGEQSCPALNTTCAICWLPFPILKPSPDSHWSSELGS